MYHLELRQFPHSMCRFNLGEAEMLAIVVPWAHGQIVDLGERKWSPHQAKLTVLEGPELPVSQLSMGRGWRAAERDGEDVTARVLDGARTTPLPAAAEASADPLALAVQLGALLGSDASRLLEAWRAVAASSPHLSPSESLARAERMLGDPPVPPR